MSQLFRCFVAWGQSLRFKFSSNILRHRSASSLRLAFHALAGQDNQIEIAENVHGIIKIWLVGNHNRIRIGTDARFNSEPSIITMYCNNAVLEIGTGTTSEGSTFHFREDGTFIIVGADCMFARETNFWATDFHSILDQTTGQRTNVARRIEIENHVWIGWGAKILKNVRLGTGSIIGTGSVVTRDIAPHSTAIGIPAVEIKSQVSWSRQLL